MKIRLNMDVAVDTKEHAQAIYDAIKDKIAWFGAVDTHSDYFIAFHKCYHDEDTVEPCKKWEEWLNGVVTYHEGEPVP